MPQYKCSKNRKYCKLIQEWKILQIQITRVKAFIVLICHLAPQYMHCDQLVRTTYVKILGAECLCLNGGPMVVQWSNSSFKTISENSELSMNKNDHLNIRALPSLVTDIVKS